MPKRGSISKPLHNLRVGQAPFRDKQNLRTNAEPMGILSSLPVLTTMINPVVLGRRDLSELRAMSEDYDDVTSHVVFVHGLGGDLLRTWTSLGPPPVFWPTWLEEDLERTGVWTLGYDAPKTNWRGAALPVPDRANDVLDRLLAEPRISTGSIALWGTR